MRGRPTSRATLPTLLAVVAVAGLLAAGHLLPLSGSGRYGVYLAAFAVWMAWFVRTVAGLLGDADGPPADDRRP